MAANLAVHVQIMRKAIESPHGHVFSAVDAARAAVDIRLGRLDTGAPESQT